MNTTLVDFEQEINELLNSQEFKKIDSYKEPISFFEISGITHKEVIHSRIISNLLTPSYRHDLGDKFLKNFLEFISSRISSIEKEKKVIKDLYKYPVDIGTEIANIDILINFISEKCVIGIENKINHFETENQLSNYQNKMLNMFPNHKKYLLFLTLDGRISKTQDVNNEDVQVYSISYHDLLGILEITNINLNNPIIVQLILNIKENLVEKSEIKSLCLDLYRQHPYAYTKLIENLPDLSEISNEVKTTVLDKNTSLKSWIYKNKYSSFISEVGFLRKNKAWGDDVHIKVYLDENMNIQIFPAIGRKIFNSKRDALNKMSYKPCFLDNKQDWYWMMLDEGLKREITVNEMFNEYTVINISEAVSSIFTEVDTKLLELADSPP